MEPIAMDAFTRYQYLSGLSWSPGSAHAALVVSTCEADLRTYRSEIWLCAEAGEALRPLTSAGKEKSYCWADENTLLFPAARTEKERKAAEDGPYTAFYRMPVDGGEARFAFSVPLRGATAQKLREGYLIRATYDPADDAPKAEGAPPRADAQVLDELPFWFNGRGIVNKKRTRLYHFLPETQALTPLTPPLGAVGALAVREDGGQVAYAMAEYDSVNPQKEALRLWTVGGEDRLLLAGDAYRISSVAFFGEGLVLSMADGLRYGTSENNRLYALPLAGGEPRLLAAPDVDIGGNVASDCRYGGGTAFQVDGDHLYLTLGIENQAFLCRMDAAGGLTRLSDGEGSVDDFAVRRGQLLFTGMRDMGLQALYRLSGGQAVPAGAFNAQALANSYVAKPRPLSSENAAGIRVDGWVLLPPGYDEKSRYPAIFSIHGGPKAAYGPVFYHEMQFWAGRGYVVFFCNPRGSAGRGDAFADLRGKYGTIDYDDLMGFCDRVLAAYPAIDPGRVCVAGGSYGGFMVNWIIGHTDRFAAASSQRSIANWTSKCLTTDIGYYHNLSQIAGDPWKTPELFWEKSPLKYAPRVKTPTLFIHANEDYRCWMAEGLQMFTALKMHGVPARMCLFEGENHELSRSGKPVNRIRRLAEITGWFDQYTKDT